MKKVLCMLCIMLMSACTIIRQAQTSSQTTTHIRDTIVRFDTVKLTVHVIDEEQANKQLAVFDSIVDSLETNYRLVNDSLAIELAKRDEQLLRLSAAIAQGKYNSDTLRANTEFAKAWAAIVNSKLELSLYQMPVDTIVSILSKSTLVRDSTYVDGQQVITNTVVEQPKAVQNPWFWVCIGIIVLTLAFLIALIRLKR